jgi:multidrug transporter EmrE-like cation transporter
LADSDTHMLKILVSRLARSGVGLVVLCTVIVASGNILLKLGGNSVASYELTQLLHRPSLLLSSWPIITGYILLGFGTAFLVLALRHGPLSVLYPIVSLTYVWVLILSILIFQESVNMWKIAGLITVVAGVGILGRDSS